MNDITREERRGSKVLAEPPTNIPNYYKNSHADVSVFPPLLPYASRFVTRVVPFPMFPCHGMSLVPIPTMTEWLVELPRPKGLADFPRPSRVHMALSEDYPSYTWVCRADEFVR